MTAPQQPLLSETAPPSLSRGSAHGQLHPLLTYVGVIESLHDSDFSEQLGQARKEEQTAVSGVGIPSPSRPAQAPGLTRQALCSHPSPFSGPHLLQATGVQLGLINDLNSDLWVEEGGKVKIPQPRSHSTFGASHVLCGSEIWEGSSLH